MDEEIWKWPINLHETSTCFLLAEGKTELLQIAKPLKVCSRLECPRLCPYNFIISYSEVAPPLEHWQVSSYFTEKSVLLEIESKYTENPTNLED